MGQLLTVAQLAELLQVSTRTVREWVSTGSIPFLKLGQSRRSLVRFSLPAVEAWLQDRAKGPETQQQQRPAPRRCAPGRASAATVSDFKTFLEGTK